LICDAPAHLKGQLRQGLPTINRQGKMQKNGTTRNAHCGAKMRLSAVKSRFFALLL
jgi:hypothetical protein